MSEGADSQVGYDRFAVWQEYEKIAMHFNDLLMRLRTQSLGGVAAIAAFAGVIVHGDVPANIRWPVLTWAFALLLLFWIAVWVLDFMYYNRLLLGAVSALVDLEKKGTTERVVALTMSITIESAVREPPPSESGYRLAGAKGRWLFYSIVFVALSAGFGASLYEMSSAVVRPRTPSATGLWLDTANCQCRAPDKR
jgi:hypothetical protein